MYIGETNVKLGNAGEKISLEIMWEKKIVKLCNLRSK